MKLFDYKRKFQIVAVVLLTAVSAYAYVTGPDDGYTNAPGDVGSCVICHDTYHEANVGPGSVRIDNVPAAYVLGQSYVLNVVIQQNARPTFGFQITVIDSVGDRIGTLAPVNPDAQLNVDTNPVGGRQYVNHTQAGTLPTAPGTRTWQVRWTAPATDKGTARFFVAGNAANNSGTNQGDYIYTNSALSESPSTMVAVALVNPPDGQTLNAGSRYLIDWTATNTTNVNAYEVRYSTDDGATFPITNLIFSTSNPDTTAYDWLVPNVPSTALAKLRVQALTKSGNAITVMSGRFAIAGTGGPPPAGVQITGAETKGSKKLFIIGSGFKDGAVVELNGEEQVTAFSDSMNLACKRAGKKISPGQTVMLRVRNPDGAVSNTFEYRRPEG